APGLKKRLKTLRGERLRAKSGIAGGRSERAVKLSRPPSERGRGVERDSQMFASQGRRRLLGKLQQILLFVSRLFGKGDRGAGFVIALHLLHGPLPSVAFV